jgi:Undecaprenyl-phosphate galactose phosphotransferase WbaP
MGLVVRQNLLDPWAQRAKRMMDIAGSVMGLLVISPFLALVALAIKLDDPGRVFYRQTRVGRDGKPFKMLKFRTMHMNADDVLQHCLNSDPALMKEWQTYQKLKNDPRITRVGKVLRRFSIDELPQVWNVLKGEMSLVGPRPIMLGQVEIYGPYFDHYKRVAPGMTGLWQVSGRNNLSFERRTELDFDYVIGWSVWLDIHLLIRTFWTVIQRDGAN